MSSKKSGADYPAPPHTGHVGGTFKTDWTPSVNGGGVTQPPPTPRLGDTPIIIKGVPDDAGE